MNKKLIHTIFLSIVFTLMLGLNAQGQNGAFIYGKVKLRNSSEIEGHIRWAAGQSLWVDLLLAEKKDNTILQYLSKEDLRQLSASEKKTDWSFMALWENQYPNRKLTFRSQFGNIRQLTVTGANEATIRLKNNHDIRIFINEDVEYKNQLGKDLVIVTADQKKVTVKWEDLQSIVFLQEKAPYPNGNSPLYGKVETRFGYFYSGLIKWDMDEYLSQQYLDGTSIDHRHIRHQFAEVKSIRPKNHGSLIQLQSGKEIYMDDHPNVNNTNAGIQIRNPLWGQITLQWGDFKNAHFSPVPAHTSSGTGYSYSDFRTPKPLRGSLTLKDNSTISGAIFYDLDERWDIETLDAWAQGGGLLQIPFREIKKITPLNDSQSKVLLRSGELVILGDRSDVNSQNWGIMIQKSDETFQYFPWAKIKEISFIH